MEHWISPAGKSKAVIVVAHEIFGLTPHIRSVCARLAAAGYEAVAPNLFSTELKAEFLPYTPEGKAEGLRIKAAVGEARMVQQLVAAGERFANGRRVGIVGFCLGGTLAWIAAAQPGTACAVGYYAVGLERYMSSRPKCSVLLHFGTNDSSVPKTTVEGIRGAFPEVGVFEYEASHAFNRDDDKSFDPQAAALAWKRTLEFCGKTLG